jgi:hypothetical protein
VRVRRRGSRGLASQGQELGVQFHEVDLEAVVAGAPIGIGLVWADAEDGEIGGRSLPVADAWEPLADIGGRAGGHQVATVFERDDRPQHSLVLRVRLTEIEVWHDGPIIGIGAKNFNGTEVPAGA